MADLADIIMQGSAQRTQIMTNTIDTVAGAIAKGISQHKKDKKEDEMLSLENAWKQVEYAQSENRMAQTRKYQDAQMQTWKNQENAQKKAVQQEQTVAKIVSDHPNADIASLAERMQAAGVDGTKLLSTVQSVQSIRLANEQKSLAQMNAAEKSAQFLGRKANAYLAQIEQNPDKAGELYNRLRTEAAKQNIPVPELGEADPASELQIMRDSALSVAAFSNQRGKASSEFAKGSLAQLKLQQAKLNSIPAEQRTEVDNAVLEGLTLEIAHKENVIYAQARKERDSASGATLKITDQERELYTADVMNYLEVPDDVTIADPAMVNHAVRAVSDMEKAGLSPLKIKQVLQKAYVVSPEGDEGWFDNLVRSFPGADEKTIADWKGGDKVPVVLNPDFDIGEFIGRLSGVTTEHTGGSSDGPPKSKVPKWKHGGMAQDKAFFDKNYKGDDKADAWEEYVESIKM